MIQPEGIDQYITDHTSALPDFLHQLERETNLKILMPNMLSGRSQGMLLKLLVSIFQPKEILEIGTFTGYATICMGLGLNESGHITTIDKNEELKSINDKYYAISGLKDKITGLFGDAHQVISTLDKTFDFVFIDADKQGYLDYYHAVFPKLKIGGLMVADNVLWKGKVLSAEPNKDTDAIKAFNDFIQMDKRVEAVIVPLRDGLFLIKKISN